jgi:hypothetical protein
MMSQVGGEARSVEFHNGEPILAESHGWELKSALPMEEHPKRGAGGKGGVRSAESNTGATIQTEKYRWELCSSHRWLRSVKLGEYSAV